MNFIRAISFISLSILLMGNFKTYSAAARAASPTHETFYSTMDFAGVFRPATPPPASGESKSELEQTEIHHALWRVMSYAGIFDPEKFTRTSPSPEPAATNELKSIAEERKTKSESRQTLPLLFQAPDKSIIEALEYTPDGKTIVAIVRGPDSFILLLSLDPSKESQKIIIPHNHKPAFAIHPKENVLALSMPNRATVILDLTNNKILKTLKHKRSITSLAWHPLSLSIIAAGSEDCRITEWNTKLGNETPPRKISIHIGSLIPKTIVWNPQGTGLAYSLTDFSIEILNISCKKRFKLGTHQSEIKSLAWHPQHNLLLSNSQNGACIWNCNNCNNTLRHSGSEDFWYSQGKLLVRKSDTKLSIYSSADYKGLYEMSFDRPINHLACHPNNKELAITQDGEIYQVALPPHI